MNNILPFFISSQDEEILSGAVSIVERNFDLIATGNKNCFIVKSQENDLQENAVSKLQVTGNIFNNNKFTISSTLLGSITLFASDEPDLLEFKTTFAAGGNNLFIAPSIADALNDNKQFSRYYFADAFTLNQVRILCKIPGERGNITFSEIVGSLTPLSGVAGISGTRGQSLLNYGNYIEIYGGGSDNFGAPIDKTKLELLASIEKKYQESNRMIFDVSGVLDSALNVEEFSTNYPVPVFYPLYPFLVIFGESFSENNTFRKKAVIGQQSVKWAKKAAAPIAEYNSTTLEKYIVESGVSGKDFMTDATQKNASPDSFELLSVLVKWNATDVFRLVILEMLPTFEDLTQGAAILINLSNAVKGGVYQFDVSPSKLNIPNIEATAGKKIRGYRIQARLATTLSQAASPSTAPLIVEPFRFNYLKCAKNSTNIVFCNSLGTFDTFEFRGESQQEVKRTADFFTTAISCEPLPDDFSQNASNIEIEHSTTLFSGWVSNDFFDFFCSLAASPKVYKYEGGVATAVYIKSMRITDDLKKNLINAEVEIVESLPFNTIKSC